LSPIRRKQFQMNFDDPALERADIELSMRTRSCLSPIDSFKPILGRRRALRGSKQCTGGSTT
jgi:hypothetical protein